ncbi:uncharacterized protein LOC122058238 isoform X2 [Macadamia integrifolia]|uniref:uncharacterized protein LOC122058238 isoform X2 n=1 Tax=Macadamia integrifolia TaxID=60698 RepID=UPI001C52CA10|nr:uncharacterized protein LOC122058238 isoform X2 [Macadamia integrifolia]
MGPSTLRQLLRSLCHNSPWKYAVFWKRDQYSRTLLTWEDGYCDCSRPGEPAQSLLKNVCISEMDGNVPFGNDTSSDNGSSVGYPIQLAVANMSHLLYSMGEGVVGKVASTAKYCWVFADSVCAGVNSELIPGYPDEWLLQFAAGIKTILLVPVVQHGVLQLGSLETVNEDLTLVTGIKDMFNTVQYVGGVSMPLTSSSDLLVLPTSSLTSVCLDNLAEPLSFIGNLLDPIPLESVVRKDPMELNGVQITKNELPTIGRQLTPLLTVPVKPHNPGKDLQPIPGCVEDAGFGALVGAAELSLPHNLSLTSNHLEMRGDLFDFTFLEKGLQASSGCNCSDVGIFSKQSDMNFDLIGGFTDQQYGEGTINQMNHISASGFLGFPLDFELRRALEPCKGGCNRFLCKPTISEEVVCGSLLDLTCHDLNVGVELSAGKSIGWYRKGGDAGHLLDVQGDSDNGAPDIHNVSSPIASSGRFAACCQTQNQSGEVIDKTGVSFESMMSTFIVEEQPKKACAYMQSGVKDAKLSRVIRTRSDKTKGPRPRPRDRQMIQDRVMELRELVPNGAKCSIDALLDRTIKHLMFLRSVTDQAEKLKRCIHEKASRTNWKSAGAQGHQNGMSWAFEMGSKLGVPPIIVEDLEHPGHLLIEMLCQEHGVFLEIAQIIGHLELTILKGAMETRADEIWAHFIVEASRGFQRMEVFWPLMLLLQRNRKSISSKF